MNLSTPFDGGLDKGMSKAAYPLGSMDSSNPRRQWVGGSTTMVMVFVVCLCVVVDGFVTSQAHRMSKGTRE